MPQAILDEANQRTRLSNHIQQRLNHLNVTPYIAGTHIVDRPRYSFLHSEVYCPAVVLNMDPVSYISAITVYRYWFIIERIREHERQEFFRKLPWSIVIAATCYHSVESESVMRGAHEILCCCFRSCIGTIWGERRVFCEEALFILRQAAHHFIR